MANCVVSMIDALLSTESAQGGNTFDLRGMDAVDNDFHIDMLMTLQDPPKAACLIDVLTHQAFSFLLPLSCNQLIKLSEGHYLELSRALEFNMAVLPVAAYLHYNGTKVLSGTETHSLTMRKGFTKKFSASVDVKVKASLSISGCDVGMEVMTGFHYDQTISTKQEETWTTTVMPGKYVMYQLVLMYKFHINMLNFWEEEDSVERSWSIYRANPNIKFYDCVEDDGSLKYKYFFMPVYKNRPFTIPYSDSLFSTMSFDKLRDYLITSPYKV